jgi:Domain of unknown function (DUF5615)
MFRFLLDEHMRGMLVDAIRQHNATGQFAHLDILVVGEPSDLPLGSPDPDILLWTEREGRLLVTFDKASMPVHLADHLAAGNHLPGIISVRQHLTIPEIIAELDLIEGAGRPEDFADTITFVP